MGKTNSKQNSALKTQTEKEEEFQIIKNNIVYNIRLFLDGRDTFQKLKIYISFVLNNVFQIYEANLEKQIWNTKSFQEIYQSLSSIIKLEQFEIFHKNFNGHLSLVLTAEINSEKKSLLLLPSLSNDKNKLNELTKSYTNLEREYIKLKQELKNNKNHSQSFDVDEENNSGNSGNSDNSNEDDNYFGINIGNNNNNFNIPTTYENTDENHILLKINYSIWCMLKLNRITYKENELDVNLDLVAIGFASGKIILINLDTLKIHQEIKTSATVYSLAQFSSDSKYLICSLSSGKMVIYVLKEENKYEEFQVLEKPDDLRSGEFNKVITLSDGSISTAERGSVSIWKPKEENGEKKFEFFKEIKTHSDTCQLLEVNPQIFACAIYGSKLINVYKNDGKEYPILGQIKGAESHGNNSNGMAKINDEIFCSGGRDCFIYIVSVNPVQLIQKLILNQESYNYIRFLNNSGDGFIFTSFSDEIIQYKIITDEEGKFIELQEFDIIKDSLDCKAIITTDNGKIFYIQNLENGNNYGNYNFFLRDYKKSDLDE